MWRLPAQWPWGPRQVILDQVANGVAVRMALIYLLSGGDPGALAPAAA